MAARRTELVIQDLLERGIPVAWATEEEAAALSGMHAVTFRTKRDDLEARGFPKIDPANGKRFIPAIMDFWRRRAQAHVEAEHDARPESEREKERWNS